jgi:putative FmdB family regulatory protein
MPLYEYQCDACGRRFEKIQKFSDPPLEACELCGKGPVHKLLSSPAIQFKGSGWYITDYAKKDGAAAGKTDSKSDAGSEKKSEASDKGAATETKSGDSGAKKADAPAAATKDTKTAS